MDLPIDVTNARLETERLTLRAWRESDLDDFYEYASVDGVGESAGWVHHASKEDTKRILDMFIAEKNVFALVLKENGKVIGSLGLHESKANEKEEYKSLKTKEIGYVLSKDYWGKGLMTEAVKAVIGFCFDVWGADLLTVGHFAENGRSRRVIEKCGFSPAGRSVYYAKQLGKSYDECTYVFFRPSLTR